ncbi:hypothetical protein RZA67_06820 [Stenotrophomonas sp. C3(2023)]|uniref:hypothetical protein n=1 Tax=Stenotrophomonas sp. C3(2023) TaxID=3080277 RepID=UPI00293CA9C8|nr:hypothetical protein [Stenotrophomonas sp. C3(2023)]MDV3468446.1 hypothetical protein [Stenotrophomonas sp. C3(2023)]
MRTHWSVVLIGGLLSWPWCVHADWRVHDERARKVLEELKRQQSPGVASGRRSTEAGRDTPAGPELALDDQEPVKELDLDASALRCPPPRRQGGGKAAAKAQQQQWQLCRDIVATELAQYRYALAMRAVALARQDRLRALEDERATLTAVTDTGRLHSNSNALLALQVRLVVDAQQYRTYMDAYAARLVHLRALQQAVAQRAVNGRSDPGAEVIRGGLSLATLELALRAARTPRRQDAPRR